MSVIVVTALVFALLMALILVRTPIAVAMAVSGVLGTVVISGWSTALATIRQGPFERATSYTLVVIPLVVVLGRKWEATGAAAATLIATGVFAAVWLVALERIRREHAPLPPEPPLLPGHEPAVL